MLTTLAFSFFVDNESFNGVQISWSRKSMKTGIKKLFLLPVLITGLGFINAAGPVMAQVMNLHSFSARCPNSDGAKPQAGLILSDNTIYGTTSIGGTGGYGVVFKVNIDGTGFTNLHSFTTPNSGTNSDGLIRLPH